MERLNLTLDDDTSKSLSQHAKRSGRPKAALARELIQEALRRREAIEQQRKLARDYAAGREDARELLADLELGQVDVVHVP